MYTAGCATSLYTAVLAAGKEPVLLPSPASLSKQFPTATLIASASVEFWLLRVPSVCLSWAYCCSL